MNLCDIHTIRPLLEAHGFHFSKAKGQNFLIAGWVPERMVQQTGVDRETGVLEIGPGIGPLTQQLCLRAAKVAAVEVDRTLAPILKETLGEFDNLDLIWGDVMKLDLPALVDEHLPCPRRMACANLPYYLTSPILSLLLGSKLFERVTVMIQKEVAQRICARPGTPEYGAFSVFCQYHTQPELLFDVPPACFLPQPKVTSAVITLPRRETPVCPVRDEATFFKVVRASFALRRKTLVNGLAAAFPQVGKAGLAAILTDCGLEPTVRGETLDIPAFAAIADRLTAHS